MTLQAKQSIKSRFIQYVLPSVAAMWVYTIYTMADGIFVARGVGEQALAAVNLCMPMINGAFSMGILFAVGASTKASIHKGRGDTQESGRDDRREHRSFGHPVRTSAAPSARPTFGR